MELNYYILDFTLIVVSFHTRSFKSYDFNKVKLREVSI